MASVIVRRKPARVPVEGAALSAAAQLFQALFPDIPASDVKEFHLYRTSEGVEARCEFEDELTLAEAKALVEEGAFFNVLSFEP